MDGDDLYGAAISAIPQILRFLAEVLFKLDGPVGGGERL